VDNGAVIILVFVVVISSVRRRFRDSRLTAKHGVVAVVLGVGRAIT